TRGTDQRATPQREPGLRSDRARCAAARTGRAARARALQRRCRAPPATGRRRFRTPGPRRREQRVRRREVAGAAASSGFGRKIAGGPSTALVLRKTLGAPRCGPRGPRALPGERGGKHGGERFGASLTNPLWRIWGQDPDAVVPCIAPPPCAPPRRLLALTTACRGLHQGGAKTGGGAVEIWERGSMMRAWLVWRGWLAWLSELRGPGGGSESARPRNALCPAVSL